MSATAIVNGILSMAHILASGDLNEEQRDAVHTIITSANAMVNVLNDLLLSSKIGAGKFQLCYAPFRPARMVRHLTRIIDARVRDRRQQQFNECEMPDDLQFTVNLDPDIPPVIVGDEGRLGQVLLNLRQLSHAALTWMT